jgi:hypothetical protein
VYAEEARVAARRASSDKTNGWKTILNTLTGHYGDRIAASSIN